MFVQNFRNQTFLHLYSEDLSMKDIYTRIIVKFLFSDVLKCLALALNSSIGKRKAAKSMHIIVLKIPSIDIVLNLQFTFIKNHGSNVLLTFSMLSNFCHGNRMLLFFSTLFDETDCKCLLR